MPTYDYECDACEHQWELFQKITDDPIDKCPQCKKKKARRLFGTGAAIVFKGSGFYQTDYRSESYKKGEKAASKSKSDSKNNKSDGKQEASSNSKPESKSKDSGTTSSSSKNKSD